MVDTRRWSLRHGHLTVSTVGVVHAMRRLTDDMPGVRERGEESWARPSTSTSTSTSTSSQSSSCTSRLSFVLLFFFADGQASPPI